MQKIISKQPSSTLRILFIASEAEPIIKVGGLGDVVGALPHYLRNLPAEGLNGYKLEVRIAIPFYPTLSDKYIKGKPLITFSIPYRGESLSGWSYQSALQEIPLLLISGPPIESVKTIYSLDPDKDMEKFIYFSLAALEICKLQGWQPDILHAHDWHSAPAVYALAQKRTSDPFFKDTKSILTIHNLPFFGGNVSVHFPNFGITISPEPALPEWASKIVFPLGLAKADIITTVSPTYSQEILTSEFGRGLEEYLKTRRKSIYGILNGLDKECWNPEIDPCITKNFNRETLGARKKNKENLLIDLGLDKDVNIPLLVCIGRMDYQKGLDLTIQTLLETGGLPWKAVIMGTGNPSIEADCKNLEEKFPNRVRTIIQFDASLARKIYASGDIFLMPSRYEPCGLSQMIAMRYGCIPLARATGGLKDTIVDDPQITRSTGFLFEEPSSTAMVFCLQRALTVFADKGTWKRIQKNAMGQDFSWQKSAQAYAGLYLDLVGKKK
jgi:starch synthase